MATTTLIKEKMRNPINKKDDWIPLREIEVDTDSGTITAIKQLGVDGKPLNVESPLVLTNGQFETEDSFTALKNLDLQATPYKNTITWNGDTAEREVAFFVYYKVSDTLYAREDFIGATINRTDKNGVVSSLVIDESLFIDLDEVEDSDYYAISFPQEFGDTSWWPETKPIIEDVLSSGILVVDSVLAEEQNISPGLYFAKTLLEDQNYLYHISSVHFTRNIINILSGGTGADNAVEALHNLGVYWSTDDAETYWSKITNGDELKKNTIYIQLIEAE